MGQLFPRKLVIAVREIWPRAPLVFVSGGAECGRVVCVCELSAARAPRYEQRLNSLCFRVFEKAAI